MPPSRDNKTIRRFYRWNAPIYDFTRWTILRGRREAIKAMNLQPGMRALEIGCGTGLNLTRLSRGVGGAGLIVGIDLSIHMLRRARRRRRENVDLLCADACRLPFRCRFDAILMAYAATSIPDWRTALEQACDRLEPGGNIVLLDFGRTREGFHPLRTAFDRYLAINHVETDRDLKAALQCHTSRLEVLRPTHAYATILRAWK